MARPHKESPDEKDKRDEELLEEYYRVIKSYGETAKYIAKSLFYQKAAEKYNITEGTARIIIQKMLRKKTKPINVSS